MVIIRVKPTVCFFLYLFVSFAVRTLVATPVNTVSWTWVGGNQRTYGSGIYGNKSLPATGNTPGARHGAASWSGPNGHYLFGGEGKANASIGHLNDLWVFNKSSLEWTWIGGSSVPDQSGTYGTLGKANSSNMPGARENAAFWQTSTGIFYLFGGYGLDKNGDIGRLNDLWQYNPFTENWTWIAGNDTVDAPGASGQKGSFSSSFSPSARDGAAFWTDMNNNLWLFGGTDHIFRDRADLWVFNTTTSEWGWVGGSLVGNEYGNYSAPGVGNSSNAPGARHAASTWVDLDGNLWLFGGRGYGNSTAQYGNLNDLWMYNISTGIWVYVTGGKTSNNFGVYDVFGGYSAMNTPGSRLGSVSFVDSLGNLQLFGGAGLAAASSLSGYLNDLWVFDPELGQWAWINGSAMPNSLSFYGVFNETNSSVKPGGRFGSTIWVSQSNDATFAAFDPVLFGGFGYANGSVPITGLLNDVFSLSEVFVSPYPTPTPTPTITPTASPAVSVSASYSATMSATTNVTEVPVGTGSAVCFPAEASVMVDRLGNTVLMSELRPGMVVIGVNGRGQLVEDTVLGWLHNEPGAVVEILAIKTLSGKQLRLTRQHLVYRMHEHSRVLDGSIITIATGHLRNQQQRIHKSLELETSAIEAAFAEDIRIGDALLDVASDLPDPVVAIDTLVTRDGLYAPLTRSGRLVVDGILVSCYGTYPSHVVAHAVLWPARVGALRTIWGSMLGTDSTVGIMPYAEGLYRMWTIAARILKEARVSVVAAAC
jgi:N-acetylneuraminic acid mutarotase